MSSAGANLFQYCQFSKLEWIILLILFPFLFLLPIYSFLLPCIATAGSLEHLAPVINPRGRGGWLFCVERTRRLVWYSRAVESPVRGSTLALVQTLPEEKRPSPEQVARNPRKGRAGSSLSGWPQAPVRSSEQSSFPFLERTCTGCPSEYKQFPPTGENPKTHGVLASQDSVPQGTSQGRAWKIKNSGIELEVIVLGIITHVVLGNWSQEVRMLRPRTAHARKKKKSKRGGSNHGRSFSV